MASAGHLVWVGFIDILPVVGSVKEAVEWVLAVAADKKAVADEKLKVINGRLGLKGKHDKSSRSSSGYASDSSSSSSSSAISSNKPSGQAAMDVASVPDTNLKAYIIEVVKGKVRQQTGKPPVSSTAVQKKLQDTQNTTLQKIRKINNNFEFNHPLVDDGKRSGRGEHVINNDVISFYHKAVDDFMKETYYRPNTLGMESPLDHDTRVAIQNELVVDFDPDELYINANALIYGEFSRVLKQALAQWLLASTQEHLQDVTHIVQVMNAEEAYVDWLARDKYIGNSAARRNRVETIRGLVVTMFTNWLQYFQEAKNAIEAMFG